MTEKKKTYIEDIERTLYDIKDEDRSVYKAHSGLTEDVVRDISVDAGFPFEVFGSIPFSRIAGLGPKP